MSRRSDGEAPRGRLQTIRWLVPSLWRQARYAFELLLEGRLWVLLLLDAFLLVAGLLESLVEGGRIGPMYFQLVVVPSLVIGLPAMSTVVDLERRAGSLDLALSVPSTEEYFLRRLASVGGFLLLQGWLALVLSSGGWDLVRALVQSAELVAFLVALTLFWAVRLPSGGAVLAASGLSVALLSRWVLSSPAIDLAVPETRLWLGFSPALLAWGGNVLVVALAAILLYQYARQRLRRPESMLV